MKTDYQEILQAVETYDPSRYSETRNYIDGDVSYLSAYISRGVLSTRYVYERLVARGFKVRAIEKFIQELAWRDYWQRVWQEKDVSEPILHAQKEVLSESVPNAFLEARTGIQAIDESVEVLYKTGYMHNHLRMYAAFLLCNVCRCDWKAGASWMYYHLLDGDLASNHLSWQWVCGANSQKQYIANQDNINKYTKSLQKGSFLDVEYGELEKINCPEHLRESSFLEYTTDLPESSNQITLDPSLELCVYNYYNLDPAWRSGGSVQRVLLLEPSIFKRYPIGKRAMEFMLALAENIESIQVFVGEFKELVKGFSNRVYFKEHPLNSHYEGVEDSREWMTDVSGYHRSFFKFWNLAKRQLLGKS